MYARAKYYRSKFIRNGIAGFALSALFIYTIVLKNESLNPMAIVFLVVSSVWLFFGLRINKKLKAKTTTNDSFEITDERIPFKYVEFVLTLLLLTTIVLSIKQWMYATYLAIPVLLVYSWWMYTQMRLVNIYLQTK